MRCLSFPSFRLSSIIIFCQNTIQKTFLSENNIETINFEEVQEIVDTLGYHIEFVRNKT